ncbi:hypothetical protein [Anaerotruncus rubiinfantis]|uniref:hypothetical protein n=1 Tax=Anaerotruncus rubiinfantis TaxID=1720200 RepID=UPI0008314416|nr:hypothetical protein [Anaerotruncus rubiinfantis]
MGTSKTKAQNKYISKTKDRFNLLLNKGQKAIIADHAKAHGESMTAFIIRAIRETMERDNQDK